MPTCRFRFIRTPSSISGSSLWSSVPVQGAVLWSLHGSSGFYQSHGSSFDLSTSCGYSHLSLPGRLVDPGFIPCPGSSGAGCSALFVSRAQDHCQLGEVTSGVFAKMIYLGVLLDSVSFRALPAQKRVEKLLSIGEEFLSCVEQLVSSWLELLGVLSSQIPPVPGGRLRMCSLQLLLRHSWDHHNDSDVVRWDSECRRDLEWWLSRSRLEKGSLSGVPESRLLVRRLGHGLGGTPGRQRSFRPLVSSGCRSFNQRQRAFGGGERSTSFCSSVGRLDCSSVR